MKHTLVIFTKRNQSITLSTKDDWIVDVKEIHYNKIFHECQIIMSDVEKYIRRRRQEGYSYLRRTR